MRKNLFVIGGLLLLAAFSHAQTTLVPGDIAIIGMNADNPDTFAFVTLVDLQTGTNIKFTDAGWLGAGGFRTGAEGTWQYTAPTAIDMGTVIVYDTLNSAWTYYASSIMTGSLALSASGDQIIAFQGTDVAPTVIYALNDDTTGGVAWQTNATSAQTSALPTGLVDGITAIGIFPELDNVVYDGTTSGTRAELLAAIGDPANWIGSDVTRQTMPAGPFNITGVEGSPSAAATAFWLMPAQPSPASSATAIQYSLSRDAKVSLTVFNMLGQKVATLASGNQSAGAHQVRWSLRNDDGAPVPNGVYFYQLSAGSQKDTRKMIVVR